MEDSLKTRHTLLTKIRLDNDDKSWDEYVRYYRFYLLAVLRKMGINHHDQQDLLQIILIKSWKALPTLELKGRFRSWIATVARNTARDHYRSKQVRKRNQEVDFDAISLPLDKMTASEVEQIAEHEWKTYIAKLALDIVKDDFKVTLFQSFIRSSSGEATKTIAVDLGISESSVLIYRKRVQKALMKEIIRLDDYLA